MRWFVVTPPYEYQEVIDPELGGPVYETCDVIEIEADSKRDALVLGVHVMLHDTRSYSWCLDQRKDGMNPFAGVKAEPVLEESACS